MGILKFIKKNYYKYSLPRFKSLLTTKDHKGKYDVLDIGCGGNSPSITKLVFPFCKYTGIDRDFHYHNNENSIKLIDKKILHDLNDEVEILKQKVGKQMFDIIIFNHVIEHTLNGLEILTATAKMLKPDGCIYIEFPSVRSLSLPSMRGTLNFCDDNTHMRIYSIQEVANTLLQEDCVIIKAGKRFNIISILLFPMRILRYIFLKKSPAGMFWDIMGFADFVFAKKR